MPCLKFVQAVIRLANRSLHRRLGQVGLEPLLPFVTFTSYCTPCTVRVIRHVNFFFNLNRRCNGGVGVNITTPIPSPFIETKYSSNLRT